MRLCRRTARRGIGDIDQSASGFLIGCGRRARHENCRLLLAGAFMLEEMGLSEDRSDEAVQVRRRSPGSGARGHGARRQRGASPDQGCRSLRNEGRRGDCGIAGVALAARGDGRESTGQAGIAGQAAVSGGTPVEARRSAHQLYRAYRRDGGARGHSEHQALARDRHGRSFPQGQFLPCRAVGRGSDPVSRTPQRA